MCYTKRKEKGTEKSERNINRKTERKPRRK